MPQVPPHIARNLFPAALHVIEAMPAFLFDRTGSPTSSQALAIDVFATIKGADRRDAILDAVAEEMGLPAGGPWEIDLEWLGHGNPLNELKRAVTRVDAAARSPRVTLLFECKFTESAPGGCSQPKPVSDGPNKGKIQCTSDYALQTNPISGVRDRCSLSGKGILYWKFIAKVFTGIDTNTDHRPCPFAGPWFQLMRNLALLEALAPQHGAVALVYADGEHLATPDHISRGLLLAIASKMAAPERLKHLSYQRLIALAHRVDPTNSLWLDLQEWVARKIEAVK